MVLMVVMMSVPAVACVGMFEPAQFHASATHDPCETSAPGDHGTTQNCKLACLAVPAAYAAEVSAMDTKPMLGAISISRLSGVALLLADPPPRMRA